MEAERIGKLTDDTVKLMTASGNIRLPVPPEFGHWGHQRVSDLPAAMRS